MHAILHAGIPPQPCGDRTRNVAVDVIERHAVEQIAPVDEVARNGLRASYVNHIALTVGAVPSS